MPTRQKFQDLNLSNAFLFAAALQDEDICRMILEMILGLPIPKVTVRAEHSILYHSEFRSVRLDVYAKDEAQVSYDVEMQNENQGNLPKRSRYHQAEMDASALRPGDNFDSLKPGYVIFICAFDPFGDGLYRYSFEERCIETDRPLGDETRKIFLNTKGRVQRDVPEVLIHFLKYVEQSSDCCVKEVKDSAIGRLHEKVTRMKQSREWEGRYLKFEELLQKERRDGMQQGMQQGLQQMSTLILKMAEDGKEQDIKRLASDPEFFQTMLETYKL